MQFLLYQACSIFVNHNDPSKGSLSGKRDESRRGHTSDPSRKQLNDDCWSPMSWNIEDVENALFFVCLCILGRHGGVILSEDKLLLGYEDVILVRWKNARGKLGPGNQVRGRMLRHVTLLAVHLADGDFGNLLQQARQLWRVGIREERVLLREE